MGSGFCLSKILLCCRCKRKSRSTQALYKVVVWCRFGKEWVFSLVEATTTPPVSERGVPSTRRLEVWPSSSRYLNSFLL